MTIVDSRPTAPRPVTRPAGVPPPPPPRPNQPPVRPAGPAPRASRPAWAVACLIAAAVLTFGVLALADIVLVPMAVVGGR